MAKVHEYEYDKSKGHDSAWGTWYESNDGNKVYFLKKFKTPKYPSEGMLSDPKYTDYCKDQIAKCEEWFSMRKRVILALKQKGNGTGNMVVPKEFFREGTSFYSVTEWIDLKNPTLEQISAMPASDKLFLMRTYASSLGKIHQVGVIHGDIKPDNILVTHSGTGRTIAKIIDFDDSYFSKEALSPEDTKSTPPYKSPELAAYIIGKKELRERLTCLSDVFASGIVFHEYWCGHAPKFNEANGPFLYQSVIKGDSYELDRSLPDWLHDLIADMLQREPENRPTMEEVYNSLREENYTRKTLKSGYYRESAGSNREIFVANIPEKTAGSHTVREDVQTQKPDLSGLKSVLAKIPRDLSSYEQGPAVKNVNLIYDYLKANLPKLGQGQIDTLVEKLDASISQLRKKQEVIRPVPKPVFESGPIVPASPLPDGCVKVEIMSQNLVKVYTSNGRVLFRTREKALAEKYVVVKK